MTPPTLTPRRHWWHRYAVVERSLMDDKQFIVSWHLTEAGAIMTVARLIAYFWDTSGGAYSPDVQDWEALPADHPLVKGLA